MSDSPVLGIDLGTTNSVVAVADEEAIHVLESPDGHQLLPSVVSFHPNGQVLVGRTARDRRLLDAKNTVYSVKRLIGRPFDSPEVKRATERFAFDLVESATGGVLLSARGENYTLSEISAFVLREVRSIAERALGQPCSKAVITVPANFNELQRSATKAAGRVAGLEVLRILNEPTAAALAYGYGRGSRERIAIFDLGGGTFDVTILELAGEVFEVLATAGDTYLGGDDIDALIAEQMAEAFLAHHRYDPRQDRQSFERLRAAAEWSKCQLSSQDEVQLRVEELAYGEGGIALDLTFGLSKQGLEAMAMPLLSRAFDVCEDAMRVAGIRPTQLDNVILVGGSTRMPLVQTMVTEYFGKTPLANINPDLVVAQGAAIQARALATSRARSRMGRVALHKVKRLRGGVAEEQIQIQDPRAVAPPPPPPPTVEEPLDDVTTTSVMELEPDDATHTYVPSKPPPPPPAPPPLAGPMTMSKPSASEPGLPPPLQPQPMMAVGEPAGDEFEFEPPPLQPPGDAGFEADPFDMPGLPAPDLAPPELDAEPTGFSPSAMPGGAAPAPQEPLAPPLLLDVTPLSLGVETVSGYCEHIIPRNSAIPTEQHRLFSTGQDDQTEVAVRICQGESRRLEENQLLGEVVLSDLPPGARGSVPIEVSFLLDANGQLGVRAVDKRTGREQSIRINLVGGVDDAKIDQMADRIEQMYAGS